MDRDDHSEARWFCSLGLGTRFGAANLWRSRVEEPGRALKGQCAGRFVLPRRSALLLHTFVQPPRTMSSATESMIPAAAVEELISPPTSLEKQPARQHTLRTPPACASPTNDAPAPKQLHAHHHFRRPQSRPRRTRRSPPSTPPRPPASPRRPSKRLAHTFPRPPPRRTPELRASERSPARGA